MRPQLRALASQQGGLITRAQALDAATGSGSSAPSRRLHGPWVIVRRGVYAERELWDVATGYDEQAGLRDRAVHLTMRTEHLMSHDSAARAHGHPDAAASARARATSPVKGSAAAGPSGGQAPPDPAGSAQHRVGRRHDGDRAGANGAWTSVASTVSGRAWSPVTPCCTRAGDRTGQGGPACGGETMWCWPGITPAKAAIEVADPGAESPGETLLRMLIRELGIGVPETQFAVQVGGASSGSICGWAVTCSSSTASEVPQGRARRCACRPPGRGHRLGRAAAAASQVCAEGLGMSRVIWDELFGAARTRTGAAFARSTARHGGSLRRRAADHTWPASPTEQKRARVGRRKRA